MTKLSSITKRKLRKQIPESLRINVYIKKRVIMGGQFTSIQHKLRFLFFIIIIIIIYFIPPSSDNYIKNLKPLPVHSIIPLMDYSISKRQNKNRKKQTGNKGHFTIRNEEEAQSATNTSKFQLKNALLGNSIKKHLPNIYILHTTASQKVVNVHSTKKLIQNT